MAKAILHAATRVIRRTTIDASPPLAPEEIAVDLLGDLGDMGGGPWALNLDNATKRLATAQEITDSDADEAQVTARRTALRTDLLDHLTLMAADATLPARVRAFATKLRALLIG